MSKKIPSLKTLALTHLAKQIDKEMLPGLKKIQEISSAEKFFQDAMDAYKLCYSDKLNFIARLPHYLIHEFIDIATRASHHHIISYITFWITHAAVTNDDLDTFTELEKYIISHWDYAIYFTTAYQAQAYKIVKYIASKKHQHYTILSDYVGDKAYAYAKAKKDNTLLEIINERFPSAHRHIWMMSNKYIHHCVQFNHLDLIKEYDNQRPHTGYHIYSTPMLELIRENPDSNLNAKYKDMFEWIWRRINITFHARGQHIPKHITTTPTKNNEYLELFAINLYEPTLMEIINKNNRINNQERHFLMSL